MNLSNAVDPLASSTTGFSGMRNTIYYYIYLLPFIFVQDDNTGHRGHQQQQRT
jgi:hypothetical protein